jgi:lysophospholipase L1-like esterase
MLECLILGDSIAVGTQMFAKQCQLVGQGGINTWQFNKMYPNNPLTAGVVIISLGTNDHKGVQTYAIRERVQSNHVYWIMPSIKPDIQEMVTVLAAFYQDKIIGTKLMQPDGIHPAWSGYKDLISQTLLE